MDAFKPLVLFVLLGLPTAAFGQNAFVLAAEDNWYPYSGKVDSRLQGFSPELITAAYSAAGASVTFEVVPFARAMDGVKRGLYAGCFNAGDYEDLQADYLVPRQALEISDQSVWGRLPSSPVKNYQDLEGKTVGIANGYTYGPLLTGNDKIRKETANEELSNLKKLALGRIDYTIIDRWIAKELYNRGMALIKKNGTYDKILKSWKTKLKIPTN